MYSDSKPLVSGKHAVGTDTQTNSDKAFTQFSLVVGPSKIAASVFALIYFSLIFLLVFQAAFQTGPIYALLFTMLITTSVTLTDKANMALLKWWLSENFYQCLAQKNSNSDKPNNATRYNDANNYHGFTLLWRDEWRLGQADVSSQPVDIKMVFYSRWFMVLQICPKNIIVESASGEGLITSHASDHQSKMQRLVVWRDCTTWAKWRLLKSLLMLS